MERTGRDLVNQLSGDHKHLGSWRALQVVSNHEKRVAQHLASRSLEHYLPLYARKSRWTDRTVTLMVPLFPGYVFLRFHPGQRLAALTIPGVLSLVGNGAGDEIPGDEIERIRIALQNGLHLQPHPPLFVGTRVRISHGVFRGTEGIITEVRRNCKVILALTAVQQCFTLEAGLEEIEVLDRGAHELRRPPGT